MQSRTRRIAAALGAGAGLALALPALGQEAPQSLLPPGFGSPPPRAPAATPPARPAASPSAPPAPPAPPPVPGADEGVAVSDTPPGPIDALVNAVVAPGQEPSPAARRSLDLVGVAPVYGEDAFGDVDGRYVATLMRRLQAPVASRWAEIMVRRVLMGATPAPRGEGKADWVADRAALLLRLGEADGARMLVQGVDVAAYSPRLRRVAIGTALATADPAGLCPLPDGGEQVGGQPAWPMIRAMCATLGGDAVTAGATIGRAVRGDFIDHALAEKLVAAGGGGRRVTTIDWTGIDTLTDWRFGLASALGVVIPQPLLDAAPAWFTAWLARAPMLAAADRIAPARAAAALGPLSAADLVDLYGRVMDESGDQDTNSPAGRLRAAYRGDDEDARLSAMHALWDSTRGPAAERDRYAGMILTGRAATLVAPSGKRSDEVLPLLQSMFAVGLDRQAERWARVVAAADDADGDRAWSILAVGAERPVLAITPDRVKALARRAGTAGQDRTAMLVAALAGLGRLAPADAAQIAADAGVSLGGASPYAVALRRAVAAHQVGTVALLVATGMQAPLWSAIPPADFYRMIGALRAVGLEPEARMIAAEAMTRLS